MKNGVTHRHLFPLGIFFIGSFLLHLLWENAQAPFFAGYQSFSQHFPICLWGTTTGDMLAMLLIYGILIIIHRDVLWIGNRATYQHPATWVLPPFFGLLFATSFELWAIHVSHRWTYAPTMPIIPLLQIGFTPLLQMIVVPPLTIAITSFTSKKL